uniref:CSON013175 protein n=1 Tax=Culicoides sonorensis TaxID=179676 RepID=A0A336M7A2_CULSO
MFVVLIKSSSWRIYFFFFHVSHSKPFIIHVTVNSYKIFELLYLVPRVVKKLRSSDLKFTICIDNHRPTITSIIGYGRYKNGKFMFKNKTKLIIIIKKVYGVRD